MVDLGRMRLRRVSELADLHAHRGDDSAASSRWPPAAGSAYGMTGLCFCLVAQVAESPAMRLEPAQRAKLFGAFVLLCIGGISLVILSWLALRVGRRNSRRADLAIQQMQKQAPADDWATRPLAKPDEVGQDSNLE